ncbi:MAG TPA: ATP-binding protein [Paludibacteraceae bacterium]|nr:ATP-binding protein [Paludibacteraceae bacterium]
MQKFYNREKEIEQLTKIEQLSKKIAQMTFVIGRRRIGKTALLKKAFTETAMLYFFVEKKNEALLCEEFIQEIQYKLHIKVYGEFRTFKSIFGYLMELSKTTNFTLIIDEFQDFHSVNSSIYSEIQNVWDANKDNSKINLILCGSIYSLMKRIFENAKEPLFGRATARIHVKAFDIKTIKTILNDYTSENNNENLLAFYLFTGGVAKYVEMLVHAGAFTLEDMVNEIFSENSLFLDEGKNVLIDEFGKEYGNYFSILSLIANSKTSRSEIESILHISIGGYLEKLENDYALITKVRPILAKPGTKNVKYKLNDNFLNFWFRFIYKYRGAVETESFDYLKELFLRDYTTYSGQILERYFKEKLTNEMTLSQIGSYWESGNQNEIDIVALNEYEKKAIIAEVKRNKDKIDLRVLEEKAQNLSKKLTGYTITYKGFSLDSM